MNRKAAVFFSNLQGKQVWFVGIGVSNTDTIGLFASQGIAVTACDKRDRSALGEVCGRLESQGVKLLLGEDYPTCFHDADVIFRTPGMYYHLPQLDAYRLNGGILTSEMEVFFDLCPCPIVAVTGSDGKTTTTTLIAEMLAAQGKTVHLGGNIGRALLPLIFDIAPEDVAAVELSSFQLISMRCAPKVAVITNVAPNHLDVHGTMEKYISVKQNLIAHQNAFSRTVLCADNDITMSFSPTVRGQTMLFSLENPVERGAYLGKDGIIYFVSPGKQPLPLFAAKDIRLPGLHNVANYQAAICAVWGQVNPDNMGKVAAEFGGVEHRIEFVRELRGVRWYNDSIATSPTRSIAGLRSFPQKIILIAGGYDKKIPFEPLSPEIVSKVSTLILMGQTADKIQAAVTACPGYTDETPRIVRAKDLAEAVFTAQTLAAPGDIVSLSPASASFDAYPNFEARGRHFKELVHGLS